MINLLLQEHAESEIQLTTNGCVFCCRQSLFKYLYVGNQRTVKTKTYKNNKMDRNPPIKNLTF